MHVFISEHIKKQVVARIQMLGHVHSLGVTLNSNIDLKKSLLKSLPHDYQQQDKARCISAGKQ